MKVTYNGFEIDVAREKSMGGTSMLYVSVFSADGEEMTSFFEDSAEKVSDMVGYMKKRVDTYLALPEADQDPDNF